LPVSKMLRIKLDIPSSLFLPNSVLVCVRVYPGTLFRGLPSNSLTLLKNLP
jgi:hypothetical protein